LVGVCQFHPADARRYAPWLNPGNRERRPIYLNVNNAKRTHDDYKLRL
jgi:hypothetical protein